MREQALESFAGGWRKQQGDMYSIMSQQEIWDELDGTLGMNLITSTDGSYTDPRLASAVERTATELGRQIRQKLPAHLQVAGIKWDSSGIATIFKTRMSYVLDKIVDRDMPNGGMLICADEATPKEQEFYYEQIADGVSRALVVVESTWRALAGAGEGSSGRRMFGVNPS